MAFRRALLILTLAAAAVMATPAPTTAPPTLVFDPPNAVVLNDMTQPFNTFRVRLSSALTGNDTIRAQMFASGLRFSSCNLDFDARNWNETRVVTVEIVPTYSTHVVGQANITISARLCTTISRKTFTSVVTYWATRTYFPGTMCGSSGDPHFISFDNARFDFQATGTFWLVRSPWLLIQVIQMPCRNRISCNSAIAVQYMDQVYILMANGSSRTLDLTLYRNGRDDSYWGVTGDDVIQQELSQEARVFSDRTGSRHEVVFRDMTRISFTVSWWSVSRSWFHNIQVYIPPRFFNRVRGLCGTWDRNQTNEFLDFQGNLAGTTRNVTRLSTAFKVDEADNLFERCAAHPNDCALDWMIDWGGLYNFVSKVCNSPGNVRNTATCSADFSAPPGGPGGLVDSTDRIPTYTPEILESLVDTTPIYQFIIRRNELDVPEELAYEEFTSFEDSLAKRNLAAANDPAFRAVVEACDNTISREMVKCAFWVDPQPYVQSCIFDVFQHVNTSTENAPEVQATFVIEHYRQLYAGSCAKVTQAIVDNDVEDLPINPDVDDDNGKTKRSWFGFDLFARKAAPSLSALAQDTQKTYKMNVRTSSTKTDNGCNGNPVTDLGCACNRAQSRTGIALSGNSCQLTNERFVRTMQSIRASVHGFRANGSGRKGS